MLNAAVAARNMRYPHNTWILDDGDRPDFAAAARRIGVGYITRGANWEGKPRFAKAGNVNNALFRTSGEFIAIFDADQVPEPEFLDRVLGYFDDPDVAFVQTPQQFWNAPKSDPLGSQAELFYGSIQQGKDGWGAAFFCGSNAVLRREALMALGLTRFSRTAAERVRRELRKGRRRVQAIIDTCSATDMPTRVFGRRVVDTLTEAEARVRRGDVLSEVTFDVRRRARSTMRTEEMPATLTEVVYPLLDSVDVARTDHALALDPIDTGSITEDMATAMRLHSLAVGQVCTTTKCWFTVWHRRISARCCHSESAGPPAQCRCSSRTTRCSSAGLLSSQRLMYLSTMTSYLNGFAAVVYIAAPVVFLLSGVFPIHADSRAFFFYFMPFFISCQALFYVAGNRARGLWRGQQMSFALFPVWINATRAGAAAAFLGKALTFSVTHKTRQASGSGLRYVRPQLVAMAALVVAAIYGAFQAEAGNRPGFATILTLFWVVIDLALLWSMVRAARYSGPPQALQNPLPQGVGDEVAAMVDEIERKGPFESVVAEADQPTQLAVAPLLDVLEAEPRHHHAAVRFDADAALKLRSDIEKCLDLPAMFLIDISRVTMVTPSGAAAMLDMLRMVRSRGGELRMFGASRGFTVAHEAMALAAITRLYSGRDEASPTARAASSGFTAAAAIQAQL